MISLRRDVVDGDVLKRLSLINSAAGMWYLVPYDDARPMCGCQVGHEMLFYSLFSHHMAPEDGLINIQRAAHEARGELQR